MVLISLAVREIDGVVTTLCQGTADDQRAILDDYFTPDAYFVHPLCRVPSFLAVTLPFVGNLESRTFVRFIYEWYRILSPKIEIQINSKGWFPSIALISPVFC